MGQLHGTESLEVVARMSRLVERRFLFRTTASVALIALLLWRIDLGAAATALRHANYIYVIPALVLFGIAKLLVAQRWRIMMSKFADLPLAPLFGILLVSNLANNIVPARIGDLIRVQVPAQRYGTSRARVAATVFATESLLDGIVFAVLGLTGLALIDLPNFPTGIFWGVLGVVAGGLIAVIPLSHLKLEPGWQCRGVLARLPERFQDMIETGIPHFIDGLVVFKDPRLGAQAVGLSFALWLIEVGMFALFGLAFGIHLSMPAWMLIMVAANMISSVPVTPSNIGAYEVAITELLKALGIGAGVAGGYAIAAHILNILWITVAGFIAMWALKLTFDDVFSFGRHERDDGHAGEPHDVRPAGARL
jgi:uncharacterized protein (TIRG00374 family)